jgi:nitrogen fixation NifU-like protein
VTDDRPTPQLASLYQELILEHYKRPRRQGRIEQPDVDIHMMNTSCGDEVRLQLRVTKGVVEDARFQGSGCSISQASLSMMADLLVGKSTADALALTGRFKELMHGDASAARDKQLGDLRALAGVAAYPVRIKCALLGWNALEEGLRKLAEEGKGA